MKSYVLSQKPTPIHSLTSANGNSRLPVAQSQNLEIILISLINSTLGNSIGSPIKIYSESDRFTSPPQLPP